MKKIWAGIKKNYQEKSRLAKISDGFFLVLMLFLIIPSGRKVILAAFISLGLFQPLVKTENAIPLSPQVWSFEFEDLEGQRIILGDFKDKVIFINFWASWCPPCVAEMPAIQKLYDQYHEQMVFIIASDESRETIQKFLQKNNYTIPFLIYKYQLPEELRASSVPATYVISKDGRIVIDKKGAAKWNGSRMIKQFDQLLRD
ncbi:MAG: TlpA family protein disulfide reductase [Bacteroidales bacterium]|nr:TlpA family protein disulfide reductase [Bacteroidales bacterium]